MLVLFVDDFLNKHYHITITLNKHYKKLQLLHIFLCKIKGKYTHGRV